MVDIAAHACAIYVVQPGPVLVEGTGSQSDQEIGHVNSKFELEGFALYHVGLIVKR